MVPIEQSTTLAPDPSSAAEARRFVRSALAEWGASRLDDVATLLVTELVTNAVLHTRSGPEVTARMAGRRLRVEVADDNPAPPVRQHYSPRAGTGRGLVLVNELASAWGTEPARRGKIVWFELESGSGAEQLEPVGHRLAPAHEGDR
ncbi:MAG: ATP-binding protein [Actinobacteria bacterium]|nr:MAG: ATP-binding protein [Actinomycetota bacterium]